MLYYCLKIIHILAATLLIGCFVHCYTLWKSLERTKATHALLLRIQKQTGLVILPLALIQLATGFTLISVQHYNYSSLWIIGSVIGFVVVIATWFSFIYFLLLSQQSISESHTSSQRPAPLFFLKRIQGLMLGLCGLALLVMIYLMTNKIGMSVKSL